ncbi:hypothetical protein LSAT2_013301 [Lamellibrachia satsuma]|nr:hypothetical protein LSAT2_013301 [Lamellibrachia satsuma]
MATAQYACDEGYKADVIGAPLVCGKSASWLGDPLVCSEIQCAMPALPVNTYVEAKSLNYKSTIVYKCHKGFAMTSGDKRRTCQLDSSWNGTEPTCVIMRCNDPPAVANTTWCVDKKSFEQRVIYKCLPRFELVSGELAKVCSSELQWTGEDPVCVESTGDWDYVMKEDEPKTPKEKMMAKIGYKASDDKVDHMATGIVASVLLVLSIAVVVALDGPLLIAHLKMMRRNVSYGMRSEERGSSGVELLPHSSHPGVGHLNGGGRYPVFNLDSSHPGVGHLNGGGRYPVFNLDGSHPGVGHLNGGGRYPVFNLDGSQPEVGHLNGGGRYPVFNLDGSQPEVGHLNGGGRYPVFNLDDC